MAHRAEAIERYARHVSRGKTRTYRKYRITFVPGEHEGLYIQDLNGKRLMNFHCNGGVFNLGHRNPDMVKALDAALDRYDVGSACCHAAVREQFASALSATMPGDLDRVLLCASGSEANDAAMKLAMRHTGRSKIVSARGGYHGGSALAVAAGDAPFRDPVGGAMPGFVQIPFGDSAAVDHTVDDQTAAVILETIPATLGMPLPPEDYYARLREQCDRTGALLIIDEVQTGLGRTGKVWAIEHWGIAPDILVTGKGLSGGLYPIAAACFSRRLRASIDAAPPFHITEYGGSDIGCAVALRVLEQTTSDRFLAHVNHMAQYLRKGLDTLQAEFPAVIREVRQKGLFMGIVFADEDTCSVMVKILFDNGLYTVYAGNDKRVLQFLPPLIIDETEADEALRIFQSALKQRRRLQYRLLAAALKMLRPKTV